MNLKNCLTPAREVAEGVTGRYPSWKLDFLQLAREKVEEYTPLVAHVARIPLSVPKVKARLFTTCANYSHISQSIGLNLSQRNLRYLFPDKIDPIVIHELGHHLWENTPGRMGGGVGVGRFWSEGFAEFLRLNVFVDVAFESNINLFSRGGVYLEGLERVAKLVLSHDNSRDFFDVPRKWPEFEKEYQEYLASATPLDRSYISMGIALNYDFS
jgi:hypothetical protein